MLVNSQRIARDQIAGAAVSNCDELKLIQYLADEHGEKICALAWLEGTGVRLASPALRTGFAGVNPVIFLWMFPDAPDGIEDFRTSMAWLDTVAPAATSLDSLRRTFEQFPEQRFRCLDYDGSDRRLLELLRLVKSAGSAGSMPELFLRHALLLLLGITVQECVAARLRPTPHCGSDVALLEFGLGRTAMVTLSMTSADVLRQGLTAHERIHSRPGGWSRTLLILPDLDLQEPVLVTTRVTVANLSREVIASALMHIARS